MKFNEDFEIPNEYILEICKQLRVFTCQNEISKWESTLIEAIDHKLFVKESKFVTWCQILQNYGYARGPRPYTLIEDYFYDEVELSDDDSSPSPRMSMRKVKSEKAPIKK